jgi:hypothetical protein
MKVKSVKKIGKLPVYDISVADNQQYVLENGIVSHNTGSYYGSDNIWIIGRQQEKDGTEISGYHFVINVEKSRYVKEKSKIPITLSYENGINKWSGLLDIALQGNYVAKPKNGWYAVVDQETGELKEPNMRASDIVNNRNFWIKIFETTDFAKYIEKTYKVTTGSIMEDSDDKSD